MRITKQSKTGSFRRGARKLTALCCCLFLCMQMIMPVAAGEENAGNPSKYSIEYLYIEETALQAGQTGHILAQVAGEGQEALQDIFLTLFEKETGVSYDLPAEKEEDGSLVFSTPSDLPAGIYGISTLAFTAGGEKQSIDITAIEGLNAAAFGMERTVSFESDRIAELSEQAKAETATEEALTDESLAAEGESETEDNSCNEIEALSAAEKEELTESVISLDLNEFAGADAADKIAAVLKGAGAQPASLEETEADNGEESLSAEGAKVKKVVIVLDPGHDSTHHHGARANGLIEEDLNLKVALYCKQYLEENYSNVTVYMTRYDGSCPHPGGSNVDDNALRVEAAASVNCDAYVSIHFNSASASAAGAMVFYPNANYNADVSAAGRKLSVEILARLVNLGLRNNGVKTYGSQSGDTYPDGSLADYYGVIRRSKLHGFPGIIIEHAFLTNPSDAAFCSSEENLKKLGIADAQGIAAAFALKEGKPVEEDGKTVNEEGYKLTCTPNKKETEVEFVLTGTDKYDKGVFFNVYSTEDEMDDIASYEGEKDTVKRWTGSCQVKDHASAGSYKVFAYVKDSKGEATKVATGGFTIQGPTAESVEVGKVSKSGTFRLTAKGVTAPSGVECVEMEVSNLSGEKKTENKKATKKGETYYVDISLSDHDYMGGQYEVKVIVTDKTDIQKEALCVKVKPDVPEPKITAKANKTESKVTLKASNLSLSGNVKSVKFKVKSLTKKKTKTYAVNKSKKGVFTRKINISEFGAAGTYSVTCYMKRSGSNKYVKVGKVKKFTITDISGGAMTYAADGESGNTLTFGGITSVSPVKEVSVKVWPKIKKTASYTYKAKNENNVWKVSVQNKNHKKCTGTYYCEITVTLKNGVTKMLRRSSFELGKDPVLYAIAGVSSVNVNQLEAYYKAHATYPSFYSSSDAASLRKFCKLYIDECEVEGIKAEVAFCQAMKETNFLRFGGDVSITQFNFAGLGATGGGVAGNIYPSVQMGIRAQIQHLKAYACTDDLVYPCIDERFPYVTRGSAPYVEWLGIPDNPYGKGWATDTDYGASILSMISELMTY